MLHGHIHNIWMQVLIISILIQVFSSSILIWKIVISSIMLFNGINPYFFHRDYPFKVQINSVIVKFFSPWRFVSNPNDVMSIHNYAMINLVNTWLLNNRRILSYLIIRSNYHWKFLWINYCRECLGCIEWTGNIFSITLHYWR